MSDELSASEERLNSHIASFEDKAVKLANSSLEAQGKLAEKLLLSGGAALGILATLFASNVSHITLADFWFPVACFSVALVASGIGIWTRSIAYMKAAKYNMNQAEIFRYLKRGAELKASGKSSTAGPLKRPPELAFPEAWYNALDNAIYVAGGAFIVGLLSAVWNFGT